MLRPGAPLLLVEHVAAGWGEAPGVRFLQEALTPLQGVLADGCHLNRETRRAVEAAGGWRAGGLRSGALDGVPGIVAPHCWGVLTAA